jgi:RNA polymerase sigma factor (sigma-70 family)
VNPSSREGESAPLAPQGDAARKRAAVETYARHEAALRRTARRYSLCADDAEDALQMALEILLKKAPSEDPRELIRWTQTVVKHEALAVRRDRERILSGPAAAAVETGAEDWVAMIPSRADGPPERAERREAVARSREALQALKPQELRALTLLAEGYSYVEIGEITGFSATKINRCLAEGRERFRKFISRSEDGRRCTELGPLISAYCDGEAAEADALVLREHLRACAHCRATLRAYRAVPAAAAAIAPAIPFGRGLLDRAHDAFAGLTTRLSGGGGATDSAISQVAVAGGTRGAGMAALAKVLAICVGTAGGAAACIAAGVVPTPLGAADADRAKTPQLERRIAPLADTAPDEGAGVEYEPAPQAPAPQAKEPPVRHEAAAAKPPAAAPEASGGAVGYTPPPPEVPVASTPSSTGSSGGNPAGEFGP